MVRLIEAGETVDANVLPYINRLSDLLWLFGRKLELDAGVSGSLRDANRKRRATLVARVVRTNCRGV